MYNACGNSVQRLIGTLLAQANIPVHSIVYRVKEQNSFIKKCEDSKYAKPLEQITDVCGLRIITYTNSDVDSICKIIEKHFTIDADNSENKAGKLQENEVGYLSVHYIAKFNAARSRLEEYKPYRDIRFEIQVRTLLQHAWAEIEHDRSYKFGGELPKDIKRRFYLIAGTLELMDREFNLLAEEINQYASEVHTEARSCNLDFDIDSTSLLEYLKVRLKDYPSIRSSFNDRDKIIIQELNDCGISTLAQLDKIITDSMVKSICSTYSDIDGVNYLGFLRDLLMVTIPEIYFSKAWQGHWRGIEIDEYNKLLSLNPNLSKYSSLFDIFP